jgi:hypothetical protein
MAAPAKALGVMRAITKSASRTASMPSTARRAFSSSSGVRTALPTAVDSLQIWGEHAYESHDSSTSGSSISISFAHEITSVPTQDALQYWKSWHVPDAGIRERTQSALLFHESYLLDHKMESEQDVLVDRTANDPLPPEKHRRGDVAGFRYQPAPMDFGKGG